MPNGIAGLARARHRIGVDARHWDAAAGEELLLGAEGDELSIIVPPHKQRITTSSFRITAPGPRAPAAGSAAAPPPR